MRVSAWPGPGLGASPSFKTKVSPCGHAGTGPSAPWNTPMTSASASVAVGADWLVSNMTVILLIVGHLLVFQPVRCPCLTDGNRE